MPFDQGFILKSYLEYMYFISFLNSDEELNVTHYTKPPNVSVTQNSKVISQYLVFLFFCIRLPKGKINVLIMRKSQHSLTVVRLLPHQAFANNKVKVQCTLYHVLKGLNSTKDC